MNSRANPRSDFIRTFAVPGWIALASGTGLVVALIGDGKVDLAACAAVAAPLAAIAWACVKRR